MRNNKLNGFTLIEVLVGVSIFSLITLSIYSAFFSAIHIQQRSERLTNFYRESYFTFETISRDIENIVFYQQKAPDSDALTFSLSGGQNSLSLITLQKDGLKSVDYFLETPKRGSILSAVIGKHSKKNISVEISQTKAASAQFLMRQEKPLAGQNAPENEAENSEALSLRIQNNGLQFSYATLKKEKDGTSRIVWNDTMEKEGVPLAIQVKITFLSPDEKEPPLVLSKDVFIPSALIMQENNKILSQP